MEVLMRCENWRHCKEHSNRNCDHYDPHKYIFDSCDSECTHWYYPCTPYNKFKDAVLENLEKNK